MFFVFSLPVAPTIKPCRFIVFKGIRITIEAIGSPFNNTPPKIILSIFKAIVFGDMVVERL